MRPKILDKLFKPIETTKGIGPRLKVKLKYLIGENIVDYLWHLPNNIIDRSYRPTIISAENNRIVTMDLTVTKHNPSRRRGLPYKITCIDETGELDLIWFNARRQYLEDILPVGSNATISGKIETYKKRKQIIHPQHIIKSQKLDDFQDIEPVYRLTQGLSNKVIRNYIKKVLDTVPDFPEWHDQELINRMKWPEFSKSIKDCHNPQNLDDLDHQNISKQRLVYDELLANQLSLALISKNFEAPKGIEIVDKNQLVRELLNNLSFELTNSQKISIEEISNDLSKSDRMIRLLQGDVGSGKTIVALAGLFHTAGSLKQGAMMAPTELLARQHYEGIRDLCLKSNVSVNILTGKTKQKDREIILKDLKEGKIDIIIGTHALFQEKVLFNDLGLVVIDEQHRFGVHQRLSLTSKSKDYPPDILIMSATPIPRTLELTAFGSMQVSRLLDKPKGRKPIKTIAKPINKISEVIDSIERLITIGEKIYWVCPLIEESEKIDLAAAEDRFHQLNKIYKDKVALIHGKMKIEDREKVMNDFKYGSKKILVATTVIEVGIDVPDATFMVIEHSERFGLSQLHQLRGRVGRGKSPSTCLLLYHPPLNETARLRIQTIRDSDDGFAIAEQDLKLRGSGELLGTRQSGLPEMRIANLDIHYDLLTKAQKDAEDILSLDPLLKTKRGAALRTLLYLFERDTAVQYLNSG